MKFLGNLFSKGDQPRITRYQQVGSTRTPNDPEPGNYPVLIGEEAVRQSLKLYDRNPYVKRFCGLLQSHCIGKGITLNTEDEALQELWDTFLRGLGRPMPEIQREIIINIALFGEVFLLVNRGIRFLNPLFFPRYNFRYHGEGYYREGTVVDDNELPTAYWYQPPAQEHRLYSVEDMVHSYLREFPGQYRGQSWFRQAIPRLQALDKLEYTAITTAELASNIPGFIEIDPGEGLNPYIAGDPTVEENKEGVKNQGLPVPQAAKPGDIIALEPGHKFNQLEVDYPTQAFDIIRMGELSGAAAALGISYAALSGDTTKSNLSSIRYGGMEDIKQYQRWQAMIGETLTEILKRVYMKATRRSKDDFYRLSFKWRSPGFDYFEPVKDITADKLAVESGLTSRTSAMARRGLDFTEEMETIAKENALMESLGIDFKEKKEEPANGQQPAQNR